MWWFDWHGLNRDIGPAEVLRRQPPAAASSHHCSDIWQMRQRGGVNTNWSCAAVVHISSAEKDQQSGCKSLAPKQEFSGKENFMKSYYLLRWCLLNEDKGCFHFCWEERNWQITIKSSCIMFVLRALYCICFQTVHLTFLLRSLLESMNEQIIWYGSVVLLGTQTTIYAKSALELQINKFTGKCIHQMPFILLIRRRKSFYKLWLEF